MKKISFPVITVFLFIFLVTVLSACSGAKSPIEPMINDCISSSIPDISVNHPDSRESIAVYDVTIDPVAGTFTVTPSIREGSFHFPLSQSYPNVLQITGYGFTPNFWADIKLKHPFPGSGIKVFDPRVITILPANPGVRFIYPVLAVGGNHSVLLEPDGYTKLFDELGGSVLGNVNPFKAYFTGQSNRIWSGTGVTEETQRIQMDINGFGGPLSYKFVVDVSTNYPNPPQSGIDNAPEPVRIDTTIGSGLTPDGGSANIDVTLLDWQGQSGIGGVKIEAPALFSGVVSLAYSAPGPNPNEYIYTGTISNSLHASEGEYKLLVAAWDQATGVYLYDEFKVNVSEINNDGNLIWAKSAGGTSYEYGNSVTNLSDNSTVITGRFEGSPTFGLGEPNQTILSSAGDRDIFVARYNADGTLAWAKRAGGTGYDQGYSVTALSDNSAVVSGFFIGSATFGPGELNQTILVSAGSYDLFIARYKQDGTLEWAKRAGGTDQDVSYGNTVLSDNSIVVTGYFSTTATFGKSETNQTILTSAGSCDIFIARYNPDGTLALVKRSGGVGFDYGYGITTLSDNTTVLTGCFVSSATFGPGEINLTVLNSAGGNDIFTARYNSDVTLAWAKCAGGLSDDYSYAITNLSDNSTVVTGTFQDIATFGPGEVNQTILTSAGYADIYIARYSPDGTLSWAKRAGGVDSEGSYGITTLSDNSVVLCGGFSGSPIFGQGEANQTVLTSFGGQDIFIAGYNPDGSLKWAKCSGGSGSDFGFGIAALSDDSSVMTGSFSASSTFGSGEPQETVLNAVGSGDIFFARYKP